MTHRVPFYLSLVAATATLAFLPGCRKNAVEKTGTLDKAAATEENAEQAFYKVLDGAFAQAYDLLEQSQTNEAVAVFEVLLADPLWDTWNDRLFSELIRFQIYVKQADTACERVLQACTAGPLTHAQAGLRLVLPYLHETQGMAAACTFSDTVTALPGINAELVRLTTEWRFFTALQDADMALASEALGAIFQILTPAESTALLDSAFDTLLAAGRLDDLEQLTTLAMGADGADDERIRLLKTTEIRLAAARNEWDKAKSLFFAASDNLPEAALQHLLYQVLPAARRADRYDIVDQCAEEVIFKQTAKTVAASQAARFWIESAMATNRAAFPERLNALLGTTIPTQTISSLFTRYFYDLIDMTDVIEEILPVADKLLVAADEETAKTIKTMRLDGSFVLEDYDKAVAYLEAGIPDRDAPWHQMAITKVKAHRALKNNQPQEAVAFFRVFMTCIDDVKDHDTVDPSTGIQHTKNMLRGRNANRIAEILSTIPDAEGAAKARAEAADYYKKAIAESTDDEARAIIISEAGDLLKTDA